LLRTLSAVLREDARTRSELEARQGWAVNAARLAVAAPWATLAMLSLRPGALAVYDSAGGVLVLLIASVTSAVAYALMRRIGRLPSDERVLS
jgi:tight adherence protein B